MTGHEMGSAIGPGAESGGPSAHEASLDQSGADASGWPPLLVTTMASLALIVTGGIYLASSIPRKPDLAPAVALLGAAGLLSLYSFTAAVMLRRLPRYRFKGVGIRALGAYVVVAGMLEYVFVLDGVRGSLLAVLSLMLVVFALDVPFLIAFTAARYADPVAPAT